jgi:hypothetical protein
MHPYVVPSAPGKVAKKSSKLRFSWITSTTCEMYPDPLLPLPARGSTAEALDRARLLEQAASWMAAASVAARGNQKPERIIKQVSLLGDNYPDRRALSSPHPTASRGAL